MEARNKGRYLLFNILGIAFSTVPVTLAVLSYFPIWVARGGEAVISGFTLLLLALGALPLLRAAKQYLASPSAHLLWFISFVVFFLLSRVADELTVISFVGFVSNLVGALLFKRAKMYKGEEK